MNCSAWVAADHGPYSPGCPLLVHCQTDIPSQITLITHCKATALTLLPLLGLVVAAVARPWPILV